MQSRLIADSLKLAFASLTVTLLAVSLSLTGISKFIGFVLLTTLAPVTSIVAIVYAIRELLVRRVLWPQAVAAVLISTIPFAFIYQMAH